MQRKLFGWLIISFALVGCQYRQAPPPAPAPASDPALTKWVGDEVTVQFRRNLLGASGTPIAPNSTWLNNTKVSLDGKIVSAHDSGIFFDSRYKMNSGDTDLRHSEFWIPADAILTIEKKL